MQYHSQLKLTLSTTRKSLARFYVAQCHYQGMSGG